MKKILCSLLAFCLAVNLCACGGSAAPAPSTPAESTPAESAPAEGEAGCSHEWAPAGYTVPETCTLCGETRGEAKPTYFAENGLTVSPLPGDGEEVPLTYMTYVPMAPEFFAVRDNGIVSISQTIEPAEEEGCKLVTLDVTVFFEIPMDEIFAYTTYTTVWNNGLYDLYTGRKVPGQSLRSNDGSSYEAELAVDDAVYILRYEKNNDWMTFRVDGEDGMQWDYKWCYQTIQFLLPEGYDGLIYALAPALEIPSDSDYDAIDGSETYVLDLTPEELAGAVFYQVGV